VTNNPAAVQLERGSLRLYVHGVITSGAAALRRRKPRMKYIGKKNKIYRLYLNSG
jgi:hypothetical protein